MRSDITITYPTDVLALIAARKATEKTRVRSSRANVDVLIFSKFATTELKSQILPLIVPTEHIPTKLSLAIDK